MYELDRSSYYMYRCFIILIWFIVTTILYLQLCRVFFVSASRLDETKGRKEEFEECNYLEIIHGPRAFVTMFVGP